MNKKIVIDAGHGGKDPGAIANGITEKDYTLKISQYIHNRLDSMGVENELTRNSDVTLDSNIRPKKVQSFYGKGNDVIVISNHINAGGGDGAEIIYALRNNNKLSSKIALELEKAGQNVRKYYQRRLPSNPSKDYYYILRETPNNEAIIIEYGFADSDGNDVNIIKNNWKILAEAVTKAIVEYIGKTYIPIDQENYYVVQKGDSLWNIAKKFNTSVDKLKSLNNLSGNLLSIGQKLKIKDVNNIENHKKYIVQKGDNLYQIAKKFDTSVNKIKDINNLNSDLVSIGQKLTIPFKKNYKTYTVQKGDNLYQIANTYNTTISKIMDLNNLDNYNLNIGQKLIIP